jgi:tetratricopeptide (TPR) repeat protein
LVYYFARDYDTAIRYFNKALSLDPEYAITNFFLGRALVQKSMYKKGIEYIKKALEIYGDSTNMLATFGNAAATAQRGDIAQRVLSQLLEIKQRMYVSSYDIASIYCGLNDIENAINWLEKAYEERSYLLIYLNVDPVLDPLRDDQRFKNLEKKIFGDV